MTIEGSISPDYSAKLANSVYELLQYSSISEINSGLKRVFFQHSRLIFIKGRTSVAIP